MLLGLISTWINENREQCEWDVCNPEPNRQKCNDYEYGKMRIAFGISTSAFKHIIGMLNQYHESKHLASRSVCPENLHLPTEPTRFEPPKPSTPGCFMQTPILAAVLAMLTKQKGV